VTLLEGFGFVLKQVPGSHRIFKHPNVPELLNVQPTGGKAKPYQIKQFVNMIEEYNLSLLDEDGPKSASEGDE
jgi:predicted RNA binding protein YcfA (HicA-like mRNA interferase family)